MSEQQFYPPQPAAYPQRPDFPQAVSPEASSRSGLPQPATPQFGHPEAGHMAAGPQHPGPSFGGYPYALTPPMAPAPARKKSSKLPIVIGAVVAGLVFVVGVVSVLALALRSDAGQQVAAVAGVPVAADRSPFEAVQVACDPSASGTTIADDGKTLIIDSTGEEDYSGISYEAVECVFTELNMSSAVRAHVGDTRALDGRQEDAWDGLTASWSYHPNQGVDMIVRVA